MLPVGSGLPANYLRVEQLLDMYDRGAITRKKLIEEMRRLFHA